MRFLPAPSRLLAILTRITVAGGKVHALGGPGVRKRAGSPAWAAEGQDPVDPNQILCLPLNNRLRPKQSDGQIAAHERKKMDDEASGEIETHHPGYLGSQDTFYVGNLKGVGRIYQQTFDDTYCKVAFAKLYTSKTPITSADLLNDRVLPYFEQYQLPMLRILTDRGTEYCGRMDQHDFQLYLAINGIDHTKAKAQSTQTNGICERFHKTIFQEFYQITFRRKLYSGLDDLQKDLDDWINYYNNDRTHQGKMCCGRTPLATLLDGKQIWAEKNLAQI